MISLTTLQVCDQKGSFPFFSYKLCQISLSFHSMCTLSLYQLVLLLETTMVIDKRSSRLYLFYKLDLEHGCQEKTGKNCSPSILSCTFSHDFIEICFAIEKIEDIKQRNIVKTRLECLPNDIYVSPTNYIIQFRLPTSIQDILLQNLDSTSKNQKNIFPCLFCYVVYSIWTGYSKILSRHM